MIHLNIDTGKIHPFVTMDDVNIIQKEMYYHHQVLIGRTGLGNDFLGWMDLPVDWSEETAGRIRSDAAFFRNLVEVVVVVGIGGSYLGARAVIEALKPHFDNLPPADGFPRVIYAGQNISEDYLSNLVTFLDHKEYAMVVISKSGTTTEPAIAFRLLRAHMEKKYGKPAARTRIITITDRCRGALKKLAELESYRTYEIPDDVGGRYSVLSPVGLLPIAIAGFDIGQLMDGALEMQKVLVASALPEENPAIQYAAARNALYRRGKPVEVLVNFEPAMFYVSEWWKQLFGESEGKDHKGIFPVSVNFTTDLHSMGQYLQDGLRVMFETFLTIDKPREVLQIPLEKSDDDGLNFIAGKNIHQVNKMAAMGTLLAHYDGGMPVIQLSIPEIRERYLGELLYFFEFACALSGYTLQVNPFDQEGVEAYKKNMFALLGKPGFEAETEKLKSRLGNICDKTKYPYKK